MKIEYDNKDVEIICTDEKHQKKSMSLDESKKLRYLMVKLYAANNLKFFVLPENLKHHLEKLKGKRRFQMSLRTKKSSGYRIIFECTNTDINDVYENMTAIKILEVSNHEY